MDLNMLGENAYNVLGLPISANQRDVRRRSKEIISRLRIDDSVAYSSDLNIFPNARCESTVKKARERLSMPKSRLQEYFFWFHVVDDVDRQAIASIMSGDYSMAVEVWKANADGETPKELLRKKNLALLYSLLLLKDDTKSYLTESLALWNQLVKDVRFWTVFVKQYRVHDELGTSQETMDDFKKQVSFHLSDIYSDMRIIHASDAYVQEFSEVFDVKGEKTRKEILSPIFGRIAECIKELEAIDLESADSFDSSSANTIKNAIQEIQNCLNKLMDVGLYEDSESRSLRDEVAGAIRKVAIDMHNVADKTEESRAMINVALQICGTDGRANKLKVDGEALDEVKEAGVVLAPIAELLEKKQYQTALKRIEAEMEHSEENEGLLDGLRIQKKACVSAIATDRYQGAMQHWENDREDEAKRRFDKTRKLINSNLELYDFEQEAINQIIGDIKDRLDAAGTNIYAVEVAQNLRNEVIDLAQEQFADKWEESILVILIDSVMFSRLASVVTRFRKKQNVVRVLNILGWITVWIYGIGLIFFVAGWIYKNVD